MRVKTIDELELTNDIKDKFSICSDSEGNTEKFALGNIINPIYRVIGNKLNASYDGGVTFEPASDYIASYFRWSDNNTIQISNDNVTWTNLSEPMSNNLFIKGYVDSVDQLPMNEELGAIYMVHMEDNTFHMHILTSDGWVDNGAFTSIQAGVVQEMGDNKNVVMSQKSVSDKFAEVQLEVDSRVSVFEDNIILDENVFFIVDAFGNVIAEIGNKGLKTIGVSTKEFYEANNGKDDLKIVDEHGNIILHLSKDMSIYDVVRIYMEHKYITPALCWIDDDFSIFESDHGGETDTILPFYQDIHDWMIAENIRMDFAYIPSPSENRMKVLHQWEDEGFRFLLHPQHDGWYAEYGNIHDTSKVRKSLTECIRHYKENNIITDCKILVWPGSSHKFLENIDIAKGYVDCGITAVGTNSNKGLVDDRYNIQRLALSLSPTKTKTMLKAYIKECLEHGDWLILYTHLYNDAFVVSDVLDETSNTSANIKEIVSYANSICKMRSTEEVWRERKFIYDFVKL
ncbi:MAG: hypothetical protein IKT40_12510 [Bacilli bacterium]|nr:hypothetical protein [Bacilli bacterium]